MNVRQAMSLYQAVGATIYGLLVSCWTKIQTRHINTKPGFTEAEKMQPCPLLKVHDPSGLSDADWAEIARLQCAYSLGGKKALSEALEELLISDRARAAGVIRALSPREIRETIDDEMIRELEVLAGDDFKLQPAMSTQRCARAAGTEARSLAGDSDPLS
jgi:hypothetical protein